MGGRQVDDPALARRNLGQWRLGPRSWRVALAGRTLAIIFAMCPSAPVVKIDRLQFASTKSDAVDAQF